MEAGTNFQSLGNNKRIPATGPLCYIGYINVEETLERQFPGESEPSSSQIESQLELEKARLAEETRLVRRGAHFVRSSDGRLELIVDPLEIDTARVRMQQEHEGRVLNQLGELTLAPEMGGDTESVWVLAMNGRVLGFSAHESGRIMVTAAELDKYGDEAPGTRVHLELTQEQINFLGDRFTAVSSRAAEMSIEDRGTPEEIGAAEQDQLPHLDEIIGDRDTIERR